MLACSAGYWLNQIELFEDDGPGSCSRVGRDECEGHSEHSDLYHYPRPSPHFWDFQKIPKSVPEPLAKDYLESEVGEER